MISQFENVKWLHSIKCLIRVKKKKKRTMRRDCRGHNDDNEEK